METAAYRLNEYRIIEYENGLLAWETHYGFGAQKSGMCFIYNDILIICPCTHEEIGYLKGEFLDWIEKLPLWNRTKSYCFASELLDVASRRSIDDAFLDRTFYSGSKISSYETSAADRGPGTFRLAKYLITVESDGHVSWKAHTGKDRLVGGQCTIHSGVLFIHPEAQEKEKESEGAFFRKLDMAPRWDGTKIWCPGFVLRCCEPQPRRERPKAGRKQAESRGILAFFEAPAAKLVQQRRGQRRVFSRFSYSPSKPLWGNLHLPSSLKLRKPSWQLFGEGNSWLKCLWSARDFIQGVISSLLSGNKGSHPFRSCDRHHRK